MNTMLAPTATGRSTGLSSWMKAVHRRLTQVSAATARDREMADAIRQLSRFDDHELDDIGLCRSDLTPDGLAAAGTKRCLRQSAIEADMACRG